jgi:hypothetical protein
LHCQSCAAKGYKKWHLLPSLVPTEYPPIPFQKNTATPLSRFLPQPFLCCWPTKLARIENLEQKRKWAISAKKEFKIDSYDLASYYFNKKTMAGVFS